jgi:hypothetical protein
MRSSLLRRFEVLAVRGQDAGEHGGVVPRRRILATPKTLALRRTEASAKRLRD